MTTTEQTKTIDQMAIEVQSMAAKAGYLADAILATFDSIRFSDAGSREAANKVMHFCEMIQSVSATSAQFAEEIESAGYRLKRDRESSGHGA